MTFLRSYDGSVATLRSIGDDHSPEFRSWRMAELVRRRVMLSWFPNRVCLNVSSWDYYP